MNEPAWEWRRLRDVTAEVRGSVTCQPGQAYELWSVPSFATHHPEILDGASIGSAKRPVRPGDVLICKINPRINRVWQVGIKGSLPQVASPEWIAVRPSAASVVDPGFLRHYLSSPKFRDWIVGEVSGVTGSHTRAKPAQVMSQMVPVPTLVEQRRIVEILEDHLSSLDTADKKLQCAASRLSALQKATLDRLFGQNLTTTLGDLVADISAGRSFGSASSPARIDEWGIIKVSAMTWGAFDADQNKAVSDERVDPRYEIHAGDLLVSRANTSEYVGASVLVRNVRPRLLLSDKSLRITPRTGVSSEWLWRALQAPSARRQISALATGTKDSMRNISQASLKAVCLPSVGLDAQEAALLRYSDIEDATTRHIQSVALQRARSTKLKRAVLAAAFDGKLLGRHADTEVIEELAYA